MAKKITDLPDLPDPQPEDILTIVDMGQGVSKKVTVANLLVALNQLNKEKKNVKVKKTK